MSGAARQRGRGRAGGEDQSNNASRRGGPPGAQPPRAPGAFDGPSSQGSTSAGSHGRQLSNAPTLSNPPTPGNVVRSPVQRSPIQSPTGFQPSTVPQQQQVKGDPARDQDKVPKLTDALKNLDLPASFYNINESVCPQISSLFPLSSRTEVTCMAT